MSAELCSTTWPQFSLVNYQVTQGFVRCCLFCLFFSSALVFRKAACTNHGPLAHPPNPPNPSAPQRSFARCQSRQESYQSSFGLDELPEADATIVGLYFAD